MSYSCEVRISFYLCHFFVYHKIFSSRTEVFHPLLELLRKVTSRSVSRVVCFTIWAVARPEVS